MRAIKFGTVGIANTGLDWAVFGLLTLAIGVPAVTANLFSYSAGILLSFILNRAWTFQDRSGHRSWTQLVLFIAGSLAGLALSTAIVALFVDALGSVIAKAVSVCITFAWNYLFSNLVVFRQ